MCVAKFSKGSDELLCSPPNTVRERVPGSFGTTDTNDFWTVERERESESGGGGRGVSDGQVLLLFAVFAVVVRWISLVLDTHTHWGGVRGTSPPRSCCCRRCCRC